MQPTPAELLDLAVTVAVEAADLVRTRRADGVEVSGTKSSPVDVVTEVDKATERLILDRLIGARPDDGFLGEEGGASARSTSGVDWVVDPIDGTVNFVYGIPCYAVSIAAAVDGQIVAGVVLNVASQERFTATLGGGAFLDGHRLAVADLEGTPLSQRLVGTGFSYLEQIKLVQTTAVAALLREVRDIRRIGSAALDLCYVAAGRIDAYVEEALNAWDKAAGALVATEAGAVLETWPGVGGTDCVLVAPAGGYAAFRDVVRRCGFLVTDGAQLDS